MSRKTSIATRDSSINLRDTSIDAVKTVAINMTYSAIGLFGGLSGIKYGKVFSLAAETVSRASFCIYLVHVLIIYLMGKIMNVGMMPAIASIPVMVAINFSCSFFDLSRTVANPPGQQVSDMTCGKKPL
jgi:hypothetical protein